MQFESSKRNTCARLIAGTVLFCLASAAGAVTTLVGGGSASPVIGYTGVPAFPVPILAPIVPATGSLLGVYSSASGGGDPTTYCPTGGTVGKKILAGNDPVNYQVNHVCSGFMSTGFGGVGLAQPFFAASDAPMTSSEVNAYVAGHGAGTQPVQLPSIAGAIAIVFRKDANAATGTPAVNSMTLTEAQICGIFSGQIRTWDDVALAGTGIPAGTAGPINVVYSGESGGISYGLLNHLSAVCPSNVAAGKAAAVNFKTLQAFAMGAGWYIPSYSTSFASPFDAIVPSYVNATNGSIGYADVADAVRAPARIASVRNSHTTLAVSPLTGFGVTPQPVFLSYDLAIADVVSPNGRPVLTPLPTTSQCIAVVDPSSYADPSSGYPILNVSYLLANAQGNGAETAAVRGLLFSPYNKTTRPQVTRIGRITTGYAWLSNATLDSTDPVGGIWGKINACVN